MLGVTAGWLIGLGFTAIGIAYATGAFNNKSSSSTGTSS